MRIADYGKLSETAIENARQAAAGGKVKGVAESQSDGGTAASGETVTVSAQARALADKASSADDSAKVQRLQSAIASGNFVINPAQIAQKLVNGD